MTDLFSRFDPGEFIGLVAVSGSMLAVITAILAGVWQRVRRTEIQAALKQDMLQRGLSADEIRTVIEAGSGRSRREYASQAHCHR